jgi:hypothetical protein
MRPQIGNRSGLETSGERCASATVNGAVRGKHSIGDQIEQRAVCDAKHFRMGRSGCGGTRIIAKALNVGVAQGHQVKADAWPSRCFRISDDGTERGCRANPSQGHAGDPDHRRRYPSRGISYSGSGLP